MTCDKTPFSSESVARRVAKRTRGNTGDRWRVYLCPDCHRFHFTTQPNFHKDLGVTPAVNKPVHGRAPRARTREDLEALAQKMRPQSKDPSGNLDD